MDKWHVPFSKGTLANCLLCGTEATPFLAGRVFRSFFSEACPFCKLSADLGSANKSHFCSLSFLLLQSLWQICLLFPSGNDAADELARLRALLVRYAVPCSLFPFHSSQIGGIHCYLNSLTHRFLWFSPRGLCSLITLAVPSYLFRNGHSLLLSFYLTRIGRIENLPAVPADIRSRTFFISFCIVQQQTFCAARSSSLYDLWFKAWRVARLLRLYGLPPCPPSLGRGWVRTATHLRKYF